MENTHTSGDNKIESWENEFDEMFPYIDGNGSFGELDDVKDFIRSAILSDRQRAVREIEKLKPQVIDSSNIEKVATITAAQSIINNGVRNT